MRILVVDDEPTILQSCGRVLEQAGYQVDLLGSVDEALKQCQVQSYDLVLVDLLLPGSSGLALLETVKDLARTTQVVVMSGYGTPSTAAATARCGAAGFLPKPFLPRELRAALADALVRSPIDSPAPASAAAPTSVTPAPSPSDSSAPQLPEQAAGRRSLTSPPRSP